MQAGKAASRSRPSMVIASLDRLCVTLKTTLPLSSNGKIGDGKRGEEEKGRKRSGREGSGRGGGRGWEGRRRARGGRKGETKRKGGQTGGKERRDEDRSLGPLGKVEKRRHRRASFCIWAAGRRIKWRVLGLIIKTLEIGLFVCDPKSF